MTSAAGAERRGEEGPWTVLRLIRWSGEYLEGRGVERGRLDAEHLLARVLGLSRLQLYLQFERPLSPGELATFKPLLLRRAAREPLQYILGRAAFRELDLAVDGRVLIPRPETEELVEAVLQWARRRDGGSGTDGRPPSALDVGTGSGCIALSLAAEGGFRPVVATDASADALELARANAEAVGAEGLELLEGPLFAPVAGRTFDVVVSNPPYVAEADRSTLQPEVADWEPADALFAGVDGLAVIRALVPAAPEHLAPGGLLALEVGPGQAEEVRGLVEATGAFRSARVRRDLSGRPRMVLAERAGPGGRPASRDNEAE